MKIHDFWADLQLGLRLHVGSVTFVDKIHSDQDAGTDG